jgi:hypothetical protein
MRASSHSSFSTSSSYDIGPKGTFCRSCAKLRLRHREQEGEERKAERQNGTLGIAVMQRMAFGKRA